MKAYERATEATSKLPKGSDRDGFEQCIARQQDDTEFAPDAASLRYKILYKLPRYKPCMYVEYLTVAASCPNGSRRTDTFTHFVVGHDDAQSLADDALMLESEGDNLDFLFGGIGDARHFFATLIYLHNAEQRLDAAVRRVYRFTLLDIVPHVIARDLVLLSLLEDLAEIPQGQKSDREQILLTIVYVYSAPVLPASIYDTMQTTIDKVANAMRESQDAALSSEGAHTRRAGNTQSPRSVAETSS